MREYNDERHGDILVTDHVLALLEKDRREACPQRTPPWYKKRNDHVTASLMATVCGANNYENRASALRRKLGVEKPFTGNEATEHGNKYEMEAILKYEALSGEKCLEFGLLESINPGEEYLAGSPDGITASGRLIEVKCPWRRVPTSVVPEMYIYQVQFLMHTLHLADCDFIQYVPEGFWSSETLIVTRVVRDDYFWQAKAPVLRRFWDEVLETRVQRASNIIEETNLKAEEKADKEAGSLLMSDLLSTTPTRIVIPPDDEDLKKAAKAAAEDGDDDSSSDSEGETPWARYANLGKKLRAAAAKKRKASGRKQKPVACLIGGDVCDDQRLRKSKVVSVQIDSSAFAGGSKRRKRVFDCPFNDEDDADAPAGEKFASCAIAL